jgi:predicted NBD/HSP70 family sugar kinase
METAEAVVAAARAGDEAARAALAHTAIYLGAGIANLVSLLDPEMVVLGGGLMAAGDLLIDGIRTEMARWAQPIAGRRVRIEFSQLGDSAGLAGAATMAFGECCIPG